MRAEARRLILLLAPLLLLPASLEAQRARSDHREGLAQKASRPLYDRLVDDDDYAVHTRCNRGKRKRRPDTRCAVFQWDRRSLEVGSTTASIAFASPVFTTPEGNGTASVSIARRGSTSGEVSVSLRIRDASATNPDDYQAEDQTVTWASGDGEVKKVELSIFDDSTVEPIETIALALSSPTGAAGLGFLDQAYVAILDDDLEPAEVETNATNAARAVVGSFSPSGLADSSGRQFLVWEDRSGGGQRIVGQILGPDGEPLGPVFPVSTRQSGQSSPSLAVDQDGNFSVVWLSSSGAQAGRSLLERSSASSGTGNSVVARSFSPNGEPQSEELAVTEESSAEASAPEASSDSSGELVVTWKDRDKVRGRAVDPRQGTAMPPFDVANAGEDPRVARSATGVTFVVWSEAGKGNASAGNRIVGRRYESSQDQEGQEIVVLSGETAASPAIAMNDEGDSVVVWEQVADGQRIVRARRFDRLGRKTGNPVRVSEGAGEQQKPRVAMNAAGDFAVVWESRGDGLDAIRARFFNRTGRALGDEITVATETDGVSPTTPDVTIEDDDDVRIVFDREGDRGVFSQGLTAALTARCQRGGESLCLQDGRFEVRVSWRAPDGAIGQAQAQRLTADTGYFWFFNPDNVELVLKILDACALGDRYWIFAGGLTDVEANIVVTDTLTGQSRNYTNPRGVPFQPLQDTNALSGCSATGAAAEASPGDVARARVAAAGEIDALVRTPARKLRRRQRANSSACTTDEMGLCLNQDRFLVEVDYETATGVSGRASPVKLTPDTGYFWFFDRTNVELVVKLLDACSFSGNYWVFAGGLTNVAVQLRVTDTVSGAVQTYENPLGTAFAPIQDTSAFPQCP